MQMHALASLASVTPTPADSASVCCPSDEATQAWARLVRLQPAMVAAVEAELKAAGFPPLAWYDALLELSRAEKGWLRPLELERAMLLPQYSTSRLVDRLVAAGLVTRTPCPVDGRGQNLFLTPAGRELQHRMWPVYAAAIQRHVGSRLTDEEATQLAALLGKLA